MTATFRRPAISHRCRSVVLFSIGLLAMPVGLGVSIQFLDKTGPSLGSGIGIVLFALGFGLLVVDGTRLLRSASGWKRIPIGTALFGLTAVSTWVIGQAAAVVAVPRTPLGDITPAALGLAYSDVEFTSEDGVVLRGWYLPSSNGAGVVLSHGSGSNRSAVLEHAALLARHGYGVLAYDARGHGESEGRTMDLGWFGDEDLHGAVSYLANRPGIETGRIALVGLSKGGEEAIGAAVADPRVSAVVAEGASGRTAEDRHWLIDRYGWRGAVQIQIDRLMYGLVDLFTPADPPMTLRSAVARTSPRPVLLIAAGNVETEVNAASYIREGASETTTLWVVANSTHVAGLTTAPDEWERQVVAFLDQALLDSGLGQAAIGEANAAANAAAIAAISATTVAATSSSSGSS